MKIMKWISKYGIVFVCFMMAAVVTGSIIIAGGKVAAPGITLDQFFIIFAAVTAGMFLMFGFVLWNIEDIKSEINTKKA